MPKPSTAHVDDEAAVGPLRIEVVHSVRAGHTACISLQLPAGATLGDALNAAGLRQAIEAPTASRTGIWGRLKPLDTALRDLDRVELYRGLQVDPKEARRLRYKQQKKAR